MIYILLVLEFCRVGRSGRFGRSAQGEKNSRRWTGRDDSRTTAIRSSIDRP